MTTAEKKQLEFEINYYINKFCYDRNAIIALEELKDTLKYLLMLPSK